MAVGTLWEGRPGPMAVGRQSRRGRRSHKYRWLLEVSLTVSI
jgi:hypothetical protein